jgi:hypothetical protein
MTVGSRSSRFARKANGSAAASESMPMVRKSLMMISRSLSGRAY